MRFSTIGAIVSVSIFGIICFGCAAGNSPQGISKVMEYKKAMERQKAQMAREEEASVKIPDLSADEYERIGDHHLSQGNMDMAFLQYNKALQLNPGQIRVHYKLGRLFLEKRLNEEARSEFQEVLKAKPDHALSYEGTARAHFNDGNYAEAEKNSKQAIRIDSALWQAYHLLGLIHDRQKQFETAIAHYTSGIAIKPNDPILLNNLGMSLFMKKEYEGAVLAFSEALKMDRAEKRIYNNLAMALCRLERYEEGLNAFKKAGDEASALYNLGCIYLMEGKNREAIPCFEKAIELNPEFHVNANEKLKQAKAAITF